MFRFDRAASRSWYSIRRASLALIGTPSSVTSTVEGWSFKSATLSLLGTLLKVPLGEPLLVKGQDPMRSSLGYGSPNMYDDKRRREARNFHTCPLCCLRNLRGRKYWRVYGRTRCKNTRSTGTTDKGSLQPWLRRFICQEQEAWLTYRSFHRKGMMV